MQFLSRIPKEQEGRVAWDSECARAKNFSVPFFIRKLQTYLEGLVSKEERSYTA